MKKWKWMPLLLAGLLLAGGCGDTGTEKKTADTGKKTVIAATEGMVRPVSYVGKDGQLTGYEVEVLKAAAKKAGYDIKFEKTEFASIFAGIDSGRYQIGFGSLNKTPQREEKYTFAKVPHYYEPAGFFVTKGTLAKHPIKKIEDLGGLTTYTNPKGESWQQFVEAFNKLHPDNPIILKYSDEDWGAYYRRLNTGDGMNLLKGMESRIKLYADEYGYHYDYVALPQSELDKVSKLADPYKWFIYAKTDEGRKIAADFDKALKELQEDGTLSKLSQKWLGNDFSSKENYDKAHAQKQ